MSWFKRRPRVKELPKLSPQRHSSTTERLLKETKESTKPSAPEKLNKNSGA